MTAGRARVARCTILPRAAVLLAVLAAGAPAPLGSQSALGHPPNLRGEWSLDRWELAFVIGHRFEFISGGDELINLPTLTLATGLRERFVLGLDFTSNSEIVPEKLGGNEAQFWLGTSVVRHRSAGVDALVAYNTAARSADGALTGRVRLGPISLLAEGRAFSDALGAGQGGGALAGGAVVHLTRYLEVSGDIGRMFRPDTLSSVWSAGVAMALPGTRHTMSLHATNTGATTLQGASRPKVLGRQAVRYGFVFTAPLGSRRQWSRIFQRDPPAELVSEADTVAARVDMRLVAFTPREVRIRAGQAVEWVNRDPLEHTVTADDESWGSPLLGEGRRFRQVFSEPGRYTYHCIPHPQMTGVVVVEEQGAP